MILVLHLIGWPLGATTNGFYFNNSSNMGTTGDFARFVNDDTNIAGDVIQNGPFTLEFTMPINLTGIAAPILQFAQYGARFLTSQSVEDSTDVGITWVDVGSDNLSTFIQFNDLHVLNFVPVNFKP
ncbi:hypothetical protein [Putridiphycobacter roseus]